MQDWLYRLQQSKTVIAIIGVLLVVWLGYNTTKVILRNYELSQKIDDLENEIAVLELENQNLEFQIGYFKTDAYLELEARDKLTKVSSGEKLLVLPDDRYDSIQTESLPSESTQDLEAVSNFKAWLDFLVGGNE